MNNKSIYVHYERYCFDDQVSVDIQSTEFQQPKLKATNYKPKQTLIFTVQNQKHSICTIHYTFTLHTRCDCAKYTEDNISKTQANRPL